MTPKPKRKLTDAQMAAGYARRREYDPYHTRQRVAADSYLAGLRAGRREKNK